LISIDVAFELFCRREEEEEEKEGRRKEPFVACAWCT
jgi:hypothetical protein